MKGRRPTPDALNALAGNPGKRKRATKAPEVFFPVDPSLPRPPTWLTSEGQRVWSEEIGAVLKTVLLQAQGLQLFAIYCDALSRVKRYTAQLADGETYETKTGFHRKRPEVELRDRALSDVVKLCDHLNISPKSWINSSATAQREQLELFARRLTNPGGQPADTTTPAPTAAVSGAKADKFDEFIGRRPPVH